MSDKLTIFHAGNALQLYLTETPERMFEYSKSMMATMGEWELIGITAKKYTLPSTASGFYDEIRFHVRHSYTVKL